MRTLKAITLAVSLALTSCSSYHLNYNALNQRTEQVLERFPELKTDSKTLTDLVFSEQGLTFERARKYNPFFDYDAVQALHEAEVPPRQANIWADFCVSRNVIIKPKTIARFIKEKTDTTEVGKHLDRYSTYRTF